MKKSEKKKHQSSIKNQYIIYIVVFTVFIFVLTVVQFLTLYNIYTIQAKKNLVAAADEISSLETKNESFMKSIAECEAAYNIYVEIYHPRDVLVYTTADNNWIYNSSTEKPGGELKPRIMKVLEHYDTKDLGSFEIRQEYFASAKYIVYDKIYADKDSGITIYYSMDLIQSNAQTGNWTIFIISMIVLVIFIALVLAYTFTFVIPIDKINGVTKRMTQMEFDRSCPSFKIRELDELSTSVNKLSAALDLTLKDLNAKNRQLKLDIEKERNLEETRKQFIANASHELKTPISIIQGYAEGLKFGITDNSPEEYCDVIIDEAVKMNNLVMRLLEITRYDYGGCKLNCSPFPIAETLIGFAASRKKSMNDSSIKFTIDIDPSYYGYGDKQLIADVFANYLSNAVSHVDFEREITVTCKPVDNSYRVSVFNTGKPIADCDINNIWQGFYRADKSHSRAEGRFGLGLSIVASVQDLHKRKYGVINHENGVEFWFDIAKYINNR